jgi:hypothetical protein
MTDSTELVNIAHEYSMKITADYRMKNIADKQIVISLIFSGFITATARL